MGNCLPELAEGEGKLVRIFFLALFVFFCLLFPDGPLADECLEGDCENGFGKGFTDEGAIYNGEWKDGLPHGRGNLFQVRGKNIAGRWEKGVLLEEEIPPVP